ncbi:MAG: FdhF/YdeP family oxidoreductase [Pseudomonadota bacterium]
MASTPPAGGGLDKLLHTLATLRRTGVRKSSKALGSKNTCKACALGMGGQAGGMTNELGEFPAVCNKSVQAQSSDLLPPIPQTVFDHPIDELKTLSSLDLNGLGRLATPLYRAAGSSRFCPIDWNEALKIAADRLRSTSPERSFFYASGRSSNEAAFLFQLFARLFGTNNVNNCSYYCHQASSVALGTTIGTGTATVELADLGRCDCFFLIGANPASNHPRLLHQLRALRRRGGTVIVINPLRETGLVRFAAPKHPSSLLRGGDPIAAHYLQPNVGSDGALLTALAKAVLERGDDNRAFLSQHCDGVEPWLTQLGQTEWSALLERCQVSKEEIDAVAGAYGRSKHAVFAWGMGLTHHQHGVANIEAVANLALLRGMVGRPGAGLLPLRGHSNVQGIGTVGVKPVLADTVTARLAECYGIHLPSTPGKDTMACMEAADAGTMDAAVMLGGNLFAANPDRGWAETALSRIAFKLYLTSSLNEGHLVGLPASGAQEAIVLPVAVRDEEAEPTTQESMFNFVRLSDGGIRRIETARPETQVLAELAQRLLGDASLHWQAFAQHRQLRHAIADCVPGMEDLQTIDVARREFHIRNRLLHTPDFQTESGRAHCTRLDTALLNPEPDRDTYPLRLTTLRSEGQFNSIVYEQRDSYRGVDDRWTVLLNPDDMREAGLTTGDRVDLESSSGTMCAVRVEAYDLPQGNAAAYYPEANALTGRTVDPRSKTPGFKNTAVRLVKAQS